MKQEYNKKVIIIDNKLYDLQEIKSVGAYNKLKETSEQAFYEELKIKNEIEDKQLKEKLQKEREYFTRYYGELELGEADEISNNMVILNSSNIDIVNHTLVIE